MVTQSWRDRRKEGYKREGRKERKNSGGGYPSILQRRERELTHTVIYPGTMVVKPSHTTLASRTVLGTNRSSHLTERKEEHEEEGEKEEEEEEEQGVKEEEEEDEEERKAVEEEEEEEEEGCIKQSTREVTCHTVTQSDSVVWSHATRRCM